MRCADGRDDDLSVFEVDLHFPLHYRLPTKLTGERGERKRVEESAQESFFALLEGGACGIWGDHAPTIVGM